MANKLTDTLERLREEAETMLVVGGKKMADPVLPKGALKASITYCIAELRKVNSDA